MPSYKVIQYGHVVEVLEYEGSFAIKRDEELYKSDKGGRDKEGKVERVEEYRATVNHKAREKVRRLITANFTENNLFITLTFRENMQDIDKANYEFKKFWQKLKRMQEGLKYVAVIEFQQRGAVHYHMICNLEMDIDFDDREDIQKNERLLGSIWGNGFVDIVNIRHVDNVGAYLIKYMSKQHIDPRLEGKKRYFFSRNCISPRELVGHEAAHLLEKLERQIPVFTSQYYNDFTGIVKKREYNSKRTGEQTVEPYHVGVAIELFGDLVEVAE